MAEHVLAITKLEYGEDQRLLVEWTIDRNGPFSRTFDTLDALHAYAGNPMDEAEKMLPLLLNWWLERDPTAATPSLARRTLRVDTAAVVVAQVTP